jgi:prophage DNA circulation protein
MSGPWGGIIPADASAAPGALYGTLLGLSWEGVGLPITETRMTLRQDLVIHKFVDKDGAHVEGTGRHPLQFEASIPFVNTIAPGISETWKQPLYPTQWRLFMGACQQGETGTLQHPEIGAITCKVESVVTTWRATERGGPTVQATWVETDDSGLVLQLFGQPSPISAGAAACANLDTNLGQMLSQAGPVIPAPTTSFTDLFNQIRGLATQAQLLSYSFGGQIQNLVYQANALETGLAATPTALNWPLFQAAEQAKDAAYTLQGNLLTQGQKVSRYTTPDELTIPAIAARLGVPIQFLLNLNPTLALTPVVPPQTVIRYYAAAA